MKVSITPHKTWKDDWYVLRWRPNGVKGARETLNVKGFGEAQERAAEIEGRAGKPQAVTFPRLRDVVNEYLSWAKKNLAEETYSGKLCRLEKHIIPALGDRRAQELTQRALDAYGANLPKTSYANDVRHIKALVTWMVKRKYAVKLDWVPESAPTTSKIKRLPTFEDAERCIAALPKLTHRMACSMMLYSGLRWNETRHLRWENCAERMELTPGPGCIGTWERSITIILQVTKNGSEEIINIPSVCHEWYDANWKPGGYLFEGRDGEHLSKIHYSLGIAARVSGVKMTPHLFRHVSGTELYRRTRDLYRVMHHLRHKNITQTQIYVRYAALWQRESVETLVGSGQNGQGNNWTR